MRHLLSAVALLAGATATAVVAMHVARADTPGPRANVTRVAASVASAPPTAAPVTRARPERRSDGSTPPRRIRSAELTPAAER